MRNHANLGEQRCTAGQPGLVASTCLRAAHACSNWKLPQPPHGSFKDATSNCSYWWSHTAMPTNPSRCEKITAAAPTQSTVYSSKPIMNAYTRFGFCQQPALQINLITPVTNSTSLGRHACLRFVFDQLLVVFIGLYLNTYVHTHCAHWYNPHHLDLTRLSLYVLPCLYVCIACTSASSVQRCFSGR